MKHIDPITLEKCRRDPSFWRNNLIIDVNGGVPWHTVMADFQKKDFAAIDPAIKYVAGVPGSKKANVSRFFIQRGRGSSKTTDIASCLLWLFSFTRKPIQGYGAAEDKDQAQLMRNQVIQLVQHNPWMRDHIDIQRKALVNKHNGATFTFLSRDTASSFGLTPDIMVADEFTHWQQQDFWTSFVSSYAKRADAGAVMIIGCNAGWGVDWKWEVKQNAMRHPAWYHSAPEGHAPWYSEDTLEEQKHLLIPSEFDRLWRNIWQDSAGEYISLKEAEACIDKNLKPRDGTPKDGDVFVAALDYAEKNDRTVGCVIHQENDMIVVDRMDVVDPRFIDDDIVRIEWCENWILEINEKFGGNYGQVYFVIDPWQLKYVKQRLESQVWIEEIQFAAGNANYEISKILQQVVLHKRIKWYPDCGAIYDDNGQIIKPRGNRDDLCTELASLYVKPLPSGKWRLEHNEGDHDDRAFTLGAAVRMLVEYSDDFDQFRVDQPSNPYLPFQG